MTGSGAELFDTSFRLPLVLLPMLANFRNFALDPLSSLEARGDLPLSSSPMVSLVVVVVVVELVVLPSVRTKSQCLLATTKVQQDSVTTMEHFV